MRLLKVTTTDGDLEYLNIERILSIQESKDGTKIKVLMGAGLYWWVWADSLRLTNIQDLLADMDETMTDYNEIMGGKN